jgi:hypothetical protein
MKYLKEYKLFESVNEKEIQAICKKYGIRNYTINKDGSIDVVGDVDLSNKDLTKFPLKFNHVSGNFDCYDNKLTSLEGSPKKIGGRFDCSDNQLTSLKGGPEYVDNDFVCYCNELTSLEGSPKSVGHFDCDENRLTSLVGAPLSVGGNFHCEKNELMDLNHLPEVSKSIYVIGNPVFSVVHDWIEKSERRWEKWEYFQDLSIIQGDRIILERLEAFYEDIGLKMDIDFDEVKKYYKIV